MKLILHADDFGYDKDTTDATIELFEREALTSASIMATMPSAENAIAYAARHKEFSFGVHLTYVDGLPSVSPPDSIPSLIDKNGLFYNSPVTRMNAMKFNIRKADIVKESLAQIHAIESKGVTVSHLDSHGHLHKFPAFLFAMKEIVKESRIKRVRRCQNVFLHPQSLSLKTLLNKCFDFCISYSFSTTDYFYMSANNMDTNWSDEILSKMDSFPQDAIIEVGVHPGHANSEKEGWRIEEYKEVIKFAEKVRAQGNHQIISWNEV